MNKKFYTLVFILIAVASINCAIAKPAVTKPETAAAIKLYKAGNYTQSYVKFSDIVRKDPSNSLAYYYLGMSSIQLGKKDEGIENYRRAIELSPSNGILGSYAKKGIKCAEDPYNCHSTSITASDDEQPEDRFIKGVFGSGFSQQARGAYEKQKIENIKREINRYDDLDPQKFKKYKDFSSQAEPTNEDIAAAVQVLQRAGLNDISAGSYNSDLSYLYNLQNDNNHSNYDMFDILLKKNKNNLSNMDPQVMQALMMTQMTNNF